MIGRTEITPLPPTAYNTLPNPAAGASYVDPVFGTTIRRLTGDRKPDDIYASNMHWSADGSRYAHLGSIIDVATGKVTHSVPLGSSSPDAGFDPVDRDVYYYLSGATIKKVVLGASGAKVESTFYTASGALAGFGGSVNWWSADGRVFLVNVGGTVRVIEKATLQPYAGSITGLGGGGWLGLAPSGNHAVGYWGNTGRAWTIDHVAKTVGPQVQFWIGLCGDHAVPISGSDGKDYCVVINCNNTDGIFRVAVDNNAVGKTEAQQMALPGNVRLIPSEPQWQNEKHFSSVARGPLQDWAFVSMEFKAGDTFNATPSGWPPYRQEIVGVNILTGEVRRLAHHRSRSLNDDYGYQPRVSCSWGGEVVGWASNFNQAGGSDIYAAIVSVTPTLPPPPPSPVNCVWSSWSAWAPVPGDVMREQRTRVVATPASNGGVPCAGEAIEFRPVAATPIDCVLSPWTPWSAWTPVSATQEQRTRTRTIVTVPANGGAACGPLTETEARPIVVLPPPAPTVLALGTYMVAAGAEVALKDVAGVLTVIVR